MANLTASSLRFEVPAPRERGEKPFLSSWGVTGEQLGINGIVPKQHFYLSPCTDGMGRDGTCWDVSALYQSNLRRAQAQGGEQKPLGPQERVQRGKKWMAKPFSEKNSALRAVLNGQEPTGNSSSQKTIWELVKLAQGVQGQSQTRSLSPWEENTRTMEQSLPSASSG